MDRSQIEPRQGTFSVGTQIEVRDQFCSSWVQGFEIAEATSDGYRLRRNSDRYVLPARFPARDLRHRS